MTSVQKIKLKMIRRLFLLAPLKILQFIRFFRSQRLYEPLAPSGKVGKC